MANNVTGGIAGICKRYIKYKLKKKTIADTLNNGAGNIEELHPFKTQNNKTFVLRNSQIERSYHF